VTAAAAAPAPYISAAARSFDKAPTASAPSVSSRSVPTAPVAPPASPHLFAAVAPTLYISAAARAFDDALSSGSLSRVHFFRGICSEVRLTKHLKRELHGSVARDFAGGLYEVALSLSSAETPRFNLPEMRVRLEWEPERAAYRLSFLSGAQVR
jgi:hypothetical protein